MRSAARHLATVAIVVMAAASCSSGDDSTTSPLIAEFITETEPAAELVFDSGDSLNLAGVSTNPARIEAGECFNEYLYRDQADFVQQVTTVVGCDGPHDREAYFAREYPGGELDVYPGDEELERWAESVCLDEFEAFVGLEYVLSALELGAIVPTFEGWTDDGDRNVVCYVHPDQGGRLLAPVAGTGI